MGRTVRPVEIATATVLGAVGVLGATAVAVAGHFSAWAARRGSLQPVSIALPEERLLLGQVLHSPQLLPAVAELLPSEFAMPSHRTLWETVRAVAPVVAAADEDHWQRLSSSVPADLVARCREASPESAALIERLLSEVEPVSVTKEAATAVARHGMAVRAAHEDRTTFNGASPIVDTSDPTAPLRRVPAPMTFRRMQTVKALLVIFCAAAPVLALAHDGVAYWAALASLLVLALTSVAVAVVDYDTMYIDLPVFWGGAALAWAAAAAAAVLAGNPGRLLAGLVVSLPLAGVFELANLVHRLVRGSDGMGFGDTLLLIATSGVPAALTGSYELGLHSLLGGLLCGLLGWTVLFAQGKITRRTPFAFGPYLALGWLVAWSADLALVAAGVAPFPLIAS